MTPFNKWCYDNADEMLWGIARCKKGGCPACMKRLEIEFHIRAAGDGYSSQYHQKSINEMLTLASHYYQWMQSNYPNKSAKQLIGTIHDLRLKMMSKKGIVK